MACKNEMMESPNPGIINIYLKVDPGTWSIGDSDTFLVNLNKMAVYRSDDVWGRIYRNRNDYVDNSMTINLFEKDSLGNFPTYQIGDSYLPPNDLVRLDFMLKPKNNELIYNGVKYPVVSADSVGGEIFGNIVRVYHDFEIKDSATTTIHLVLNMGNSLYRKFDEYIYAPEITVNENP